MRAFIRRLPEEIGPPLPQAMDRLTPKLGQAPPPTQTERSLRDMADLASLLERGSPLGLCLRRSVTRYYFLRRAGLPLSVHFGARRSDLDGAGQGLVGHAWTVLNDEPYHEEGQNWRGFTVMLAYPPAAERE